MYYDDIDGLSWFHSILHIITSNYNIISHLLFDIISYDDPIIIQINFYKNILNGKFLFFFFIIDANLLALLP